MSEFQAPILIVDDDRDSLELLRSLLDGLGHPLVEARSGAEALERLGEQEFAVVVLDVQMPELGGLETAKLIRARESIANTPIIFLTAYGSDEFPVRQAYELGAVDYLVKPLEPIILRAKVAGFVQLFMKIAEVKAQAERIRRLEREGLERTLRNTEQRFAGFMDHLPGLAWIKDAEGRYIYANAAAAKAFRSQPAALLGKTDLELFSPETAAQFRANDERARVTPDGVQVVETLDNEAGDLRHSLVCKFPIPDEQRGPLVGGMAIDITDRLRAEESLKEADRRKDEFLAMLAHELRNPLAPIRNALFILNQGGDEGVVREATEIAERQVKHMGRLLDDLLDVSRVSRGKISLRTEPVSVAAVLKHGAGAVRGLITDQNQSLHIAPVDPALHVTGDATRLEQIVINLLTNASKYTDRGGTIRLSAERDGDQVLIRIADNGIGISASELPRIFDLYMQAEHADRPTVGVGIGLALVKKLVELHHGTIEARSEGLGRGSEFLVRLPAEVSAVKSAEPAAEEDVPPRRVLVVDDHLDAANSLKILLQVLGHDVTVAHDGAAALDLLDTYRPEVAFVDLGMPVMDGFEVARRIRQRPDLHQLTLVALTGWGQKDDRRKTREAGFDQHLVKPVEPGALQKVLTSAGENSR